MFSGKRGSLRKVLCKPRNKSDSSSSATSTTSTGQQQPMTPTILLDRPPSADNANSYFPFPHNDGSGGFQGFPPLPEGFPQPPTTPTAPGHTRLRVDSNGHSHQGRLTSQSSVDSGGPLTVDVNCVCNFDSMNKTSPEKGTLRPAHRVFTPQLSGPASTMTTEVCRVHGHEQLHHHRSISASPQYGSGGLALVNRSMPTALNAPLLIPLGSPRGGSNARSLVHRANVGGGILRPSSANLYLATRLNHPTVFDFEDWHTSLDKQSQEAVYSLFMKAHKCYDLIPTSSKLVVFDTQLQVSKAFFALVYNGVRAAPLWDSKVQDFVGMLTITDFIQILHKYYIKDQVAEGIRELEEHKIATWREVFADDGHLKSFITIDPSESLYRAVQILCDSQIHRLPVMEATTGNILYILTHKRLIKFLFLYINDLPKPSYMNKTPRELGIGSWGDICTISKHTSLIDAMKIFLQKRVSALPLLDEDGRVIDIYAKFDAINLAADKTYSNLDVSVFEALKQRSDWFEGVRKCSEKDSLMTVIDIIVKAEVHRLIVTDDEQRVVGIISLSDILKHLVLDPPAPESEASQLMQQSLPLLEDGKLETTTATGNGSVQQ